jgi:hypothetical protein
MLSSKKMTYKGALRQAFICLRPRTLYPLPFMSIWKGGGGRFERLKVERLKGQQITKLSRK